MDSPASLASNMLLGLETALSVSNLLYCLAGVVLGTVVGVLPGIGAITAISMLFPLTYHLDPTSALIMLAGIWYGSTFGGAITSILLNIPGTPANAVTCLDGYPMAQQGRGSVAMLAAALGSFFGGCIGILILMLFSPTIAGYALSFSSVEYFALMVLGLVAATTISHGSAIKGLAMVVLGIAFGCVGSDVYTGIFRFNFGFLELADGISLIALAMGIFGVAEVISSLRSTEAKRVEAHSVSLRSMKPAPGEVRRSVLPMLRGSGIGAIFGALPGTGPSIAAFMAYAMEIRVARDPSRFGKGAVEGVVAPEAANNAADQTAFIPTLSLGIPGSPTMALMLGALMIHGIAPGPLLMTSEPQLFWGLVMSMWIGSLFLIILNIPLISIWVRLLLVPYRLLVPAVIVLICIGTYSVHNSTFDVWLIVFFGLVGYAMRIFGFPAAPLLLGFVLGPMMEEHFRRAMLVSRGDAMIFLERPISGAILLATAALLVWGFWGAFRARRSTSALRG